MNIIGIAPLIPFPPYHPLKNGFSWREAAGLSGACQYHSETPCVLADESD